MKLGNGGILLDNGLGRYVSDSLNPVFGGIGFGNAAWIQKQHQESRSIVRCCEPL